jgi:hypothetical protein
MSDMRSDDWRTDDSHSEAEIRRRLAEEAWERVEVVGVVQYHFTSVPAGGYTAPPTMMPPARVKLEQLAHSA